MGTHRPRACEVCSAEYRPTYPAQRTCGRVCGVSLRRAENGTAGRSLRACKRCDKRHSSITRQNRVCDDCRGRMYAERACDVCGARFTPTVAKRKRCSDECARTASNRAALAYMLGRYRSDPSFRDKVISAAQNRRADKLGSPQITTQAQLLGYLFKRDRGRCGICRKPVRARRGPMRPSVDHIIPLSVELNHSLENVQLAHYRCNLSKGNRGGGEQLLLVG